MTRNYLLLATSAQDDPLLAEAGLRGRHLPHPGVLQGHVPRPRAQRHAETRVVSRVMCPAVATILADTDPEAWPLTYICSGHC